ncbi:hypothetical protein [Streptomyces sp. NBC_00847]|uniref:hypothetical protein n=1 Tax=Streptomyces sp. NBC_00847 TaxID=2975850 RepID=UPI00225E3BE2|nr:hypothetical protein [Streptomyces sp. NBC_00847]MCX4885909.1 hypothetical protein [Streptomyces sp. NBC_00847]
MTERRIRPIDISHDELMDRAAAEHEARTAAEEARTAASRADVLREVAEALTARHCSPESIAIARLLVTHRLCTDCKGYGQTVTDTPDGGIVRRCRSCDGAGLRRMAAETAGPAEPPCCSDPTCTCNQVNAAGRCDCAKWDTEPATQAEALAEPPSTCWQLEMLDGMWAAYGPIYADRAQAVAQYRSDCEKRPTWNDVARTPVQRRIVRRTTTYTVEQAVGAEKAETQDAPPVEPHPTEADLRHALAVAAKFHGQKTDVPPEIVHGCPPDGSGLTPCCGRTPFELPLGDRISSEAPVTCPGPAAAPAAVQTEEA